MLSRLHLQNFTVFADADFLFSPGLNVLVGTNGTGKSHVLKAGYISARVTARILNDKELAQSHGSAYWEYYLSQRLSDVFQAGLIGDLVRWSEDTGIVASVKAEFGSNSRLPLEYWFGPSAKKPVVVGKQPVGVSSYPTASSLAYAVFIPPKEVLTLYWIRGISGKKLLPIDDTYPALLDVLYDFPERTLSDAAVQAIATLQEAMGGQVVVAQEAFYLSKGDRLVEMNLIAEGHRKFALLEQLLRNGFITPDIPLFWDEPEANLNPALLKTLARVLGDMARQGFQIIIATHSLFLLKELHILSRDKKAPKELPIRYFGLNKSDGTNAPVTVATQDNFELLPDITALDEELQQADELEAIFAREDHAADAHD